ncbi:hypothetical protein SAMN05444722_3482 [Rhodovulum sp. ES.010]|uniref:hypothetical protein n=1 Tax=Rhodovulum sp. ES.010 TaxID=1882821 RepID=UPI0009260246|nr:hypothetical protein [Rhodovulum sp. ES.010]SIO55284.1 hypothetical protein SAMN05444722_3482 [Rhodovulum sp. ES.010]
MEDVDFADPVEVWLAAMGDPSPLVALLIAGGALPRRTRHALAAWLSGAFGQARAPGARTGDHVLAPEEIRRDTAAANYLRIAARAEERGYEIDGDSLARQVARKWRVPLATLRGDIARARTEGMPDILDTEARAFRAWQGGRRAVVPFAPR